MTDIKYFFDSLHASWISRFLEADPNIHSWAQIPKLLLGSLDVDGKCIIPRDKNTYEILQRSIIVFQQACVCDEELFERSILNQPVWGNKFITRLVRRKKKFYTRGIG